MSCDAFEIVIRPWTPTDSIPELTELLHRAYAPLAAMGLNYTATYQDDATTQRRIANGECYVAVLHQCLAGAIVFEPASRTSGSPFLDRPDVASFKQFAVEPTLQRRGIGARLLNVVETRARETLAAHLALDTAEPAVHLIDYYSRKGYRIVDHVQWRGKTYRSVVMSKALAS